jgi:serine/threonine protein kinase
MVRKLTIRFGVRNGNTISSQRSLFKARLLSLDSSERSAYLVDIWAEGKLSKPVNYYIDMEPCSYDLETFITKISGSDSDVGNEPWKIMLQLSSAVSFVHKCGLIVRDLKPSRGFGPYI